MSDHAIELILQKVPSLSIQDISNLMRQYQSYEILGNSVLIFGLFVVILLIMSMICAAIRN